MTDLSPTKGLSPDQVAERVEQILAEATLAEKVQMMSGKGFFKLFAESGRHWGANPYPAGSGVARLNVPPLYFTDGPRGVARGNSTCFPCTMARGATFDVDLEQRIGEAMSIEIRAQDCTLSGAVCVNLLRHPAWGRAQETYGEDPCHLGEMGAALAIGLQTHNVIATVKHYALNSMENARFKVDVQIDERALHEVYLPHFKTILDAGCATVMSAYNQMNGTYCGQSKALLTDILRVEWGFEGFVHSDWVMGLRNVYAAPAGLDIENPEPLVFGKHLLAAVEAGQVEPQVIDQACRRILSTQYRFACAEDPLPAYSLDMVAQPAHIALALEAALKSAVLLKNEMMLPLDRTRLKKLAVLGQLANKENTGDFGSSRVRPPYVVTALQGLQIALGEATEIVTGDETDVVAAVANAADADAIIVVAGYTARQEGEYIPEDMTLGVASDVLPAPKPAAANEPSAEEARGGDRTNLSLPTDQIALIEAACATGRPVLVVLVAGSAVLVEGWQEQASAILQSFYSGMEGGTALAQLVLGEVAPSGKLPFTVAKDPAHYPFFDKDANAIIYDYWHGYTKFEREQIEPRYGFGHGLSYSCYGYRALRLRRTKTGFEAHVSITNLGDRAGEEIAQLYVGFPGLVVERPAKVLKAFARVALEPGQTKVIRFNVDADDLRYRDPATHTWRLEPGMHKVFVGGSAALAVQLSATISL